MPIIWKKLKKVVSNVLYWRFLPFTAKLHLNTSVLTLRSGLFFENKSMTLLCIADFLFKALL